MNQKSFTFACLVLAAATIVAQAQSGSPLASADDKHNFGVSSEKFLPAIRETVISAAGRPGRPSGPSQRMASDSSRRRPQPSKKRGTPALLGLVAESTGDVLSVAQVFAQIGVDLAGVARLELGRLGRSRAPQYAQTPLPGHVLGRSPQQGEATARAFVSTRLSPGPTGGALLADDRNAQHTDNALFGSHSFDSSASQPDQTAF